MGRGCWFVAATAMWSNNGQLVRCQVVVVVVGSVGCCCSGKLLLLLVRSAYEL